LRYQTQIDIRVFVGSASYGHSTHMLFSHFVEKILPKNAYDTQLLQRIKAEAGLSRPALQTGRFPGTPGAAPNPPAGA
jgi:hypothetical protein